MIALTSTHRARRAADFGGQQGVATPQNSPPGPPFTVWKNDLDPEGLVCSALPGALVEGMTRLAEVCDARTCLEADPHDFVGRVGVHSLLLCRWRLL